MQVSNQGVSARGIGVPARTKPNNLKPREGQPRGRPRLVHPHRSMPSHVVHPRPDPPRSGAARPHSARAPSPSASAGPGAVRCGLSRRAGWTALPRSISAQRHKYYKYCTCSWQKAFSFELVNRSTSNASWQEGHWKGSL